MQKFLLLFFFIFFPAIFGKAPHERNFFRLSQNENNCEEACLKVGGTPCAHDYDLPSSPEEAYDSSQYDIIIVCCDQECEPGIESDPYHYLPYCRGRYLKFTC